MSERMKRHLLDLESACQLDGLSGIFRHGSNQRA